MNKSQQLLIGLSFLFLSILIANLPSFLFSTKANSITQVETKASVQKSYAPTALAKASEELSDFSLQDENGEQQSFRAIKGDKPALIYFFAGGCGHCLQMLPKMQQTEILYRAKSLGYAVMAVEYYGSPTHGKQMQQEYSLPSPILADQQAQVCGKFGVGEFTIFLVGADNILYFRDIMNGNNWPTDDLLKTVASKPANTNNTSNIDSSNNVNPVDPVNPVNSVDPVDSVDPITSNNTTINPYDFLTVEPQANIFATTFLANNINAQRLYQIVYLMALLATLLGTIVALAVTKESWLPILAISQMFFLGTYYHVWIQNSLAPIFFLAILCLMFNPQKNRLISASLLTMTMFLTLTAFNTILGALSGISTSINLMLLWQVIPTIASSLALLYLALRTKQTYSKYAYPAPNFSPEPLSAEGAIAIRGVSKAERCDICHQVDKFNFETGYCQRCNAKTI